MDFKQIEAFVNVVKYKSFSKAADACFLTQPTISAHINTIEKELSVQLLDRNGRGALPTVQGKLFYKYALTMLNTREKAVLSIKDLNENIKGILEVQASAVPGQYMLPALFSGFKEHYPNVKFYLQQSDSEEVARNILDGKGELGFTGAIEDSTLIYHTLLADELVVITPASHKFLDIEGDEIELTQFMDEPMIWREQGSGTRREFEAHMASMGVSQKSMRVAARMNSLEAVKQSVARGLGVSIISRLAVEDSLETHKIRMFHLKDFHMDRRFYLTYNKNITLSPMGEAFRNYTLEVYQKNRTL